MKVLLDFRQHRRVDGLGEGTEKGGEGYQIDQQASVHGLPLFENVDRIFFRFSNIFVCESSRAFPVADLTERSVQSDQDRSKIFRGV